MSGPRVVGRLWALAVFAVIPVWLVLAGGLLLADRRPPALVTAAPGSAQLKIDSEYRRSVVRDYTLYVTPSAAAGSVECHEPRRVGGPEPIVRSEPDRPATAVRTHQGVTYARYGKVYAMTSEVQCTGEVTGLLLTKYDGDHTGRNFAVFLLIAMPVLLLIAVRLLRRRPG